MRNTTKLKMILQKYAVSIQLDLDEQWNLVLTDLDTSERFAIQEKSYSAAISKAYSQLLRALKTG